MGIGLELIYNYIERKAEATHIPYYTNIILLKLLLIYVK